MASTERPARWYQRVLPVCALALVVVALAALVAPGFRHQLALSASHRTDPYLELSFTDAAKGSAALCATDGRKVRVDFTIDSHLEDSQDVEYAVSTGKDDTVDSLPLAPGESGDISVLLAHPAGEYDVVVRLTGTDQLLTAHCGGATS